MTAARHDLVIEQAADWSLDLTWQSSPGVPVDLTGWSAYAQVRQNAGDTGTPLIDFEDYITLGGVGGTILIEVPASVLLTTTWERRAAWDLVMVGPANQQIRLLKGKAKLDKATTVVP